MNHEVKDAVLYVRVSSVKQTVVGDGLRSQETRCRQFAEGRGYNVIDVFQDDVTGSLAIRPGIKAMLATLRKRSRRGTVVIIDDISRLARGLKAHLQLRTAIAEAGGILESPSMEFGDDPDSMLVENLMASTSQYQQQNNARQTKNRMRSRLESGYAVFQAPTGYRYQRVTGRGRMLMRNEPVASIVQEALEGYASERFETQADVVRFLSDASVFPKTSHGKVRHTMVGSILTNPTYAGMIEAPNWSVSRRQGMHQGLISVETFLRIQERLKGGEYAARRKNLNAEFPLRGFVLCAHCATPLTACFSHGRHGTSHPYYLCPKRGCASYGKSIRRAKIEGEFEEMLRTAVPTEGLLHVATMMFKEIWDYRIGQAESSRKALAAHLTKIESEKAKFLTRIVETSVPAVVSAYEDRINQLESERLAIREKLAAAGKPGRSFDDGLRTALTFLSSPWKLWASGELEDKRTVLKLTFATRLEYERETGFRTASLSLPFKVLSQIFDGGKQLVRPRGIEPLFPP